jgi:hypothetical protein
MILAGDALAVRKKSLMIRKIMAATGGVRRMTIIIITSAISTVKENVGSKFKLIFYNIILFFKLFDQLIKGVL